MSKSEPEIIDCQTGNSNTSASKVFSFVRHVINEYALHLFQANGNSHIVARIPADWNASNAQPPNT
jgi:hypothetical protein